MRGMESGGPGLKVWPLLVRWMGHAVGTGLDYGGASVGGKFLQNCENEYLSKPGRAASHHVAR